MSINGLEGVPRRTCFVPYELCLVQNEQFEGLAKLTPY
jgi:hypothetical protein